MYREKGVPVFVKIDEYKDVIEIMELMRNKIEQAKKILARINELKNQEDTEMTLWQSNIGDIERRLEQIGDALFESENI
jgi:hypothetical protein